MAQTPKNTESKDSAALQRIKSMCGHRERLRERIVNSSPSSLQDYELMEYLLHLVIPRTDTKLIAKHLINKYGSVNGALSQSSSCLQKVDGIGSVSATFLETLGWIMGNIEPEKRLVVNRVKVDAVRSSLVEFLTKMCVNLKSEWITLVVLDASLNVTDISYINNLHTKGDINGLAYAVMEKGDGMSANFNIKDIVRSLLAMSAKRFVLVHNHSQTGCKPSKQDLVSTERLAEAIKYLDIELVDHMIVGNDGSVFSFFDHKLID